MEGDDSKEYEGDKKDVEALSVHIETALRVTAVENTKAAPPSLITAVSLNHAIPSKEASPSHSAHQSPIHSAYHTPVHASGFPHLNPSPASVVASVAKVAIALYEWTPQEEGELLIHENDMLIVLDDSDSDWWMVKHLKTPGEGLVPKTYIEVCPNLNI